MIKDFNEVIKSRRSVRVFLKENINTETVKECIKNATLAPNSSNLQLWEFYHVTNKKSVKKLQRHVSIKVQLKLPINWLWLFHDVIFGEVVPRPIIPIYPRRFKLPIHLVLLEKKWYSTIMENSFLCFTVHFLGLKGGLYFCFHR